MHSAASARLHSALEDVVSGQSRAGECARRCRAAQVENLWSSTIESRLCGTARDLAGLLSLRHSRYAPGPSGLPIACRLDLADGAALGVRAE